MLPVAILMYEHRLIERMLQLIRKEIVIAGEKQRIDMSFLDALVDFIQWYVDRTHHSKEEDILFKDVAKKDITAADRELLLELIEEHDFGRRTVVRLVEVGERFLRGSAGSLQDILDKLETLADFYQEHIKKKIIFTSRLTVQPGCYRRF